MGGAVGTLVSHGGLTFAAVGPRLVVLDESAAGGLEAVGQSDPLAASILRIVVNGGMAFVATFEADRPYRATDDLFDPFARATDPLAGNVEVFDVRDPRRIRWVGQIRPVADPVDIATAGSRLYIASAVLGPDDLAIGGTLQEFDVSDPAQISEVNRIATRIPMALAAVGENIYLLSAETTAVVLVYDASLELYRAGDLPDALPAASIRLDLDLYGVRGDLAVVGGVAFAAVDEAYVTGSGGTVLVDVHDPARLHPLAQIHLPASRLAVSDGYLALFNGDESLLFDVGRPAWPHVVAKLTARGGWGTLADGHILLTDGRGIERYRLRSDAAPEHVGDWTPLPGSTGRLAAGGGQVYVVDGNRQLTVIDPIAAGGLTAVSRSSLRADGGYCDCALAVAENGDFLTVADMGWNQGTVAVIDASDPSRTVFGAVTPLKYTVVDMVTIGKVTYVLTATGQLLVVEREGAQLTARTIGATTLRAPASRLAVAQHHAFAATNDGFRIANISDPGNPRLVDVESGPPTKAVAAIGDRMAVADAAGVRLFDITRPSRPRSLALLEMTDAADLAMDNAFLYIATNSQRGLPRVLLVSLANPGRGVITAVTLADSVIDMTTVDGGLVVSTSSTGIYWLRPLILGARSVWLPAISR